MGIHRLLHSSCSFLNTNAAITRQLIRTARMLEVEWWQVCGEAWVRGQRMMNQVLDAFGLLDFTMLRPVLAWRAFWNLWSVYLFNFPIFFSGRDQPRILNPRIRRSTCIQNPITTHIVLRRFKEVVKITVLDTKRISQNRETHFAKEQKRNWCPDCLCDCTWENTGLNDIFSCTNCFNVTYYWDAWFCTSIV